MSALELTMADAERDPEGVRAWLCAHDLEPTDTAPGVRIEGGQVTAKVWLRGRDGKRQMLRDPDTGLPVGAAHETVTRALRQAVPDGLGTEIP